MPQNISELLFWVLGLVVAALAWFLALWMARHDKRTDEVSKLVAGHETEIKLLRQADAGLAQRIEEMHRKLDKNIEEERAMWRENYERQSMILTEVATLKQRVADSK